VYGVKAKSEVKVML